MLCITLYTNHGLTRRQVVHTLGDNHVQLKVDSRR